jgi:predicted GH43/DUF377 family glycosyl hydrolase
VEETKRGYIYSACAALLDLNNPVKAIARLPYALFLPEYEWELKGVVNNVLVHNSEPSVEKLKPMQFILNLH